MIAYIKGRLSMIMENQIIVENNGIGFNIMVPSSVINELPHTGSEVCIHTYMNVREDAMQLFGFLDRDDLLMFGKLITVNGVGPKGALGILSALSPDDLRFAILSEDVKAIAKAPGIGAKTASKLILELKDKVDLDEAFEKKLSNVQKREMKESGISSIVSEAVAALVALGYSQSDALKGVNSVDITPDMTVEQLLKEGLKRV